MLRPRLTAQLDDSAGLTLVIAPAGYGKTALLSNWLDSSDLPSAWLSLDEQDNDPALFITYLVSAVRTLFPTACPETLALLQGIALPPSTLIGQSLSQELAAVEQEFVLVLDDYHLIHDRSIHEILAELTRHPPPPLYLVFASRIDPALPLASLRARGDVIELRQADLRFSLEETASLLRDGMQMQVDDRTLSDLNTRTEGWVAGLRLTALYFQHVGDLAGRSMGLSGYNRYTMDYLVAEILVQIPARIKEFLLKTSILDRLCAPLCAAVTDIVDLEDGRESCLAWLERNNLFLLSLDDEQHWHRYHHLFRKLLLDQLGRQVGRAELAGLHMKASDWFADNEFSEEALRHALAAGRTEVAAQIVARHRCELMNNERWHLLERWVHLFPREVIDQEPELLLSEVWFALNREQHADMAPVLDRVEALLAQLPLDAATADRLMGEVENRRCALYFFAGDTERSMVAAQRALEKTPITWWMLRAMARLFLSLNFLAIGDLRQANATHYDSGEPVHDPAFQLRMLAHACFVHWIAADLSALAQAATQILTRENQAGFQAGYQVETITWARYHLGICHYQRNELAEAEEQLTPLVRQPYLSHVQCYLHSAAALALICQAQGRPDEAREIAERMVSFSLEIDRTNGLFMAKAFQAELALRQGRLAEAGYWAEHTNVPFAHPMPFYYRPPLTQARIFIAQNTSAGRQRAGQGLSDLYDYVTSIHYTSVVIEVLTAQALLHQAEGRQQAASTALQQAIAMAEPGGSIRPFIDLGEPLQELLIVQVREQTVSPFEAKILAAFPQNFSPAAARRQANAALFSPLTPRELEVLALLEKRYTNNEIAESLVISVETVATHLQHIGNKLGTRGRRAIVQAAKDLGLLE